MRNIGKLDTVTSFHNDDLQKVKKILLKRNIVYIKKTIQRQYMGETVLVFPLGDIEITHGPLLIKKKMFFCFSHQFKQNF